MISATRQRILELARECLETPFQHQGRIPGKGLDCVGLIRYPAVVLDLLDPPNADVLDYTARPNPDQMYNHLVTYFDPIQESDLIPGDFLWMQSPNPQHLALFAGETIIHAMSRAPFKVTEHIYGPPFTGNTCGWFRYKKLFD